MKPFRLIIIFVIILSPVLVNAQFSFERAWGTYFGDESIRFKASKIDREGNLYIVGRVWDFGQPLFEFTTPNAHQPVYGGGESDGFIAKLNPEGYLIWATYFGGSDYDRIEDIQFSDDNTIYVVGNTFSSQNIATPNAYQPNLDGDSDAFIAKFQANGTLVWSTYFGGNGSEGGMPDPNENNIRSGIALDGSGNVYIFNTTQSSGLGTIGTFQAEKEDADYIISKFNQNGNRMWSTYYGINNAQVAAIAISDSGLILGGRSFDCPPNTYNTYFATPNSHQPIPGNCADSFITKFSFEGGRIWSTYYGGTGSELFFSDNIKTVGEDIYFGSTTTSNNNISTTGSYQETKDNNYSNFLVKFNGAGQRIWGTYCGDHLYSQNNSWKSNINIDPTGNVYIAGRTGLPQNISTPDAYQDTITGNDDAFLVKFSPQGERLWGTYYGGIYDEYWSVGLFYDEVFYIVGRTRSIENITTPNTYQPEYITNNLIISDEPANIFIVKFEPNPLSLTTFDKNSFTLYPNPNKGIFTVSMNGGPLPEDFEIHIFNALGQTLYVQPITSNEETLYLDHLASGLYFAEFFSDGSVLKTIKMIVE